MKKTAEQLATEVLEKMAQGEMPYEEEPQKQPSVVGRGIGLGLTGAGAGATVGIGSAVHRGLKSKGIRGLAESRALMYPALQTKGDQRLVKAFKRMGNRRMGKGALIGLGIGGLLGAGSALAGRD